MGLLSGITDAVGLTDSGAAADAAGKARGVTRAQMARLDKIKNLTEEELAVELQSPELVALLEAQGIDPSKLGDIQEDQSLRDNQMRALAGLSEQAEEGLTSGDKYAMEQMLGQVDAQEQSNQAAIEQDMARRGMDSSGAALMSKLQSKQSGSNNARDKAMQMAAQAQQNKMNALSQLGAQSGNMASQDFNRKAQVASAQDQIARANAMNRQNVSGQNIAARQGIENQRANIANQQQMYNVGTKQQILDNEFKKAGAQNSASQNLANSYMGQAQAQQQADSATMGAITGLAGSLGGAYIGKEDGGIVSKDTSIQQQGRDHADKQHENFKKKYMKRVHNELDVEAQQKQAEKEVTGQVHAADGAVVAQAKREMDPNYVHAQDGATMYASDGMGDIVDSGMDSFADDRVDAKINDGEAILNVPQQQRFMDLVRGKIGVDELGNDDIVEGVPRDYRDSMHEKLEDDREGSDKMAGLEKLLEMLGR